ncbi:MAG: Gfo/Idh/MocA family oxidoreductase [Verrucomicrobiota bacterium]
MTTKQISRRNFLKTTTPLAAGAPWFIPSSALGLDGSPAPSNRVTIGAIGVGPQGNGVLGGFLGQPDVQVVAVCDVNTQRREQTRQRVDQQYKAKGCTAYNDFRELCARPDIDVVSIASTDHWHVLHALAAVRGGKDVYVEKPLGLSLAQDQALRAEVQRRGRLFQFGTQQRSSSHFRLACELVRNGRIGKLHTIRVAAPPSHGSGNYPPTPVPDWLDYEMWLGPAPWAPFTDNRVINDFWWHISDYALGFVAGWGIHHVDIAQWGNDTDLTGPVEIEGTGVFPTDGLCNCATAWNIEMNYAHGVRMIFTDDQQAAHGIRFEGSDGWVFVHRSLLDAHPKSLLQSVIGPDEVHLYDSRHHQKNLIDCFKSRGQTVCPIEVAVRSDALCHLSDIAMRLGRKLHWDPQAERFHNDDTANRMLARTLRSPWRL